MHVRNQLEHVPNPEGISLSLSHTYLRGLIITAADIIRHKMATVFISHEKKLTLVP